MFGAALCVAQCLTNDSAKDDEISRGRVQVACAHRVEHQRQIRFRPVDRQELLFTLPLQLESETREN